MKIEEMTVEEKKECLLKPTSCKINIDSEDPDGRINLEKLQKDLGMLTRSDYYHIAEEHELGYGHREAYMEFMADRFPMEKDGSYAAEWAERFKVGTHWGSADSRARKALKKAYGIELPASFEREKLTQLKGRGKLYKDAFDTEKEANEIKEELETKGKINVFIFTDKKGDWNIGYDESGSVLLPEPQSAR